MPYIKKIDAEKAKDKICTLYNNEGDWRALADTMGIPKSTAYRWVKNQNNEAARGGRRRVKIEEVHRRFMCEQIEQNPKLTLKEMKEKLQVDFDLSVSVECIRNHLDGLLYTLKNIRHEPERANIDSNKLKRQEYVRQLLQEQANNVPILYMDETNFNLHISRTQGRSLKGTRCTTIAAGSKGANVHVIGCISTMGLIHYEVRRGSFKMAEANNFVRQTLRNARNLYQNRVTLVIDNAPCHSSIEEVFLEEEFAENKLLRLSPYSPMLNAIEMTWSVLKSQVKSQLSDEIHDILNNNQRNGQTQREYRLVALENIINGCIRNIRIEDCTKNIAHVQRYFADALNLVNLNF